MWDKKTLIVPIIIGALGSIPNDLECDLNKLGISYNVGTANILRKVLSIKQQIRKQYGAGGKKGGMVSSQQHQNISLS